MTRGMRRIVLIAGIALTLGAVLAVFFWPLPAALTEPQRREPLRVLDRGGNLLYAARMPEFGSQEFMPLQKIPSGAIQALLATEDRTFFAHPGVSLRGIVRAALADIRAGAIVQGGSTITQQLVRILLPSPRRTFTGKITEMYYAWRIERRMTKEEILERYLNTAYFGHQAYGIQAAAQTFLGKSAPELSTAESALLIGLIQSPTAFDPFNHLDAAIARQHLVFRSMRDAGVLSEADEKDMRAERIVITKDRVEILAPHFVLWLLDRRATEFADQTEVRTTLDLDLQRSVERSIEHQLPLLKGKNVTSAAVIVLDAHTGDILAMVGSADYFDADHDGAVNVTISARQPGSTLKPFTYALALAAGDTTATTVADVEAQFETQEGNPYTPRNYDYDEHGLVRYREALANSYNIAAVKVLQRVGVEKLLNFLRAAGMTTLTEAPEHYGLALTLGAGEVRLLELTSAYSVFARAGNVIQPRAVLSDPVVESHQILRPEISWLIADILSDPVARMPEFGSAGPLNFDRPVAAKTGTTRNSRDNWVIGFTPDRIVGVWVGNADNTPMRDTSGVSGAGPIFHDVMLAAMQGLPRTWFPQPSGIVEREICRLSGKLPTPLCTETISEVFIAGVEPREPNDMFREIGIDTRTGKRATEHCDQRYVQKKVFTVFPPELQKWARERGFPQPPAEVSHLCGPASGGVASARDDYWLTITTPRAGDSFLLDPLVPNRSEKLFLEARASDGIATIVWRVNGKEVGRGSRPDFRFAWQPVVGAALIEAVAGEMRDVVRIEVLDK